MSKRDAILFENDDGAKKADPIKLAASPDLVSAMVSSNSRNGIAGTADRRPMVYRAGSLDACRQAEPVLADLERLRQARAPGFTGLAALQALRDAIAKATG